jgi:hypothetical protein
MKNWLKQWVGREPDVIIGPVADPYLHRWHLIPRNPVFNVYVHHFFRSDDDRALHDHPWINLSVLLKGSYDEHVPGGIKRRRAGSLIARGARGRHRIALIDGQGVWTLFLTGPRTRKWGFHCPEGWVAFDDFEKQGGCEGMNNAFEIPVRKQHSEKDFYGFRSKRR